MVGNIPHSGTHLLSKAIRSISCLVSGRVSSTSWMAPTSRCSMPCVPAISTCCSGCSGARFGRPTSGRSFCSRILMPSWSGASTRSLAFATSRCETWRATIGSCRLAELRAGRHLKVFLRVGSLADCQHRNHLVGNLQIDPCDDRHDRPALDARSAIRGPEALDHRFLSIPPAGQSRRRGKPSGLAIDPFASTVSGPAARASAGILKLEIWPSASREQRLRKSGDQLFDVSQPV